MRFGKYRSFERLERAWEARNLDPPEDTTQDATCECCGEIFTFDPGLFLESDGESVFCEPPKICGPCEAAGCDPDDPQCKEVRDADS